MTHNVVTLKTPAAAGRTSLWRRLLDWNKRRLTKRMLHDMPDYLLRDIGIRRFEIDGYVEGRLPAPWAAPSALPVAPAAGVAAEPREHAKAA